MVGSRGDGLGRGQRGQRAPVQAARGRAGALRAAILVGRGTSGRGSAVRRPVRRFWRVHAVLPQPVGGRAGRIRRASRAARRARFMVGPGASGGAGQSRALTSAAGRRGHRHHAPRHRARRRLRRRRCGCIRQRLAVPVPERRGHVHRKRQLPALVGQPATGRTRGARTGCLHHGRLGGRRIHLLVLGGCGAAAIAVWYRRVHAMADADHRLTLFGIVSTWAHGAPHAPTDAVPVERGA